MTAAIASLTKIDWSAKSLTSIPSGSKGNNEGSFALTALTTSSVEAPPFFSAVSSKPRWPSCRTILICGENPSRTCATSRKKVVAPPTVRTGILLSSAMLGGDEFSDTLNSVSPIFVVPAGSVRFCVVMALMMSEEVIPLASKACGSISTDTARTLPPYGNGMAIPGIVISCGRRILMAASNNSFSARTVLDIPS